MTSENKLYENWDKHHPLVKHDHQKQSNQDHLSYNFMDPKIKDKLDQEIRQECITKLTKHLSTYNESKQSYENTSNGIEPLSALKFLYEFKTFFEQIQERRLKDFREIRKNLYELPYNSSRDPLRRVCFLLQNLLSFNKDSIFSLLKLLKKSKKFLQECEQKELTELNNRCFQIMDMYLQMNDLRNEHFFRMYSEEKEEIWNEQTQVWKSEIDIWDGLMCKLLQSNYQIVFDKLNKHLKDCEILFTERLTNFDELQRYFIEIENNAFLKTILQKDVSYFKN